MTSFDAAKYLTDIRWRGCNWYALFPSQSVKACGIDLTLAKIEAIAIAEKLQREASQKSEPPSWYMPHCPCTDCKDVSEKLQNGAGGVCQMAGRAFKNNTITSACDDLPPLEWRKIVDLKLEMLLGHIERLDARDSDLHEADAGRARYAGELRDRLDKLENGVRDVTEKGYGHDYRIEAWGEVVSDALKKIVAQDERLAKLESRAEFTRDVIRPAPADDLAKIKSRLDKLESAAFLSDCQNGRLIGLGHVVDELVGRVDATYHKVNELAYESSVVMPLKD
jgi:hypothetical protein